MDLPGCDGLRAAFGLVALQSLPDAPDVDTDTLAALAKCDDLSDSALDQVLDHLERYVEWRDAFTELVVADFHAPK